MPQLTYLGPSYTRRMPDSPGAYTRGQTLEVSQDWVNQWRNYLPKDQFRIEGDEGESVDNGDGLPDKGWNRKNILGWLKEKGVETGTTYLTKSAALALVQRTLNPPSLETTEDVIQEAIIEENNGDEQ